MLTLQQRIYLVKCYGIGAVSYRYAIQLFNEKYPDVPVTRNGLKKLLKKFDETGSVEDKKKSKKTYNEDDDAATALAMHSVRENPKLSLRKRAAEVGFSKSHLQKIFKQNKIHPFKPKFIHTLQDCDYDTRLDFCAIIGEKLMNDRFFHYNILFSDEATFTTNGTVSSQNCRYWASENPYYRIQRNSQFAKKVNVWCAVLQDRIIGPYFLEETLNQEVYLDLLDNFLIPELDDLPLEQRRKMYFQHDGCSSHSTLLIRGWLDEYFPERWIGRYGPIFFPPRSPDLTILDFFYGAT